MKLILFLSLLLASCSVTQTKQPIIYEYEYVSHIEWDSIFNQKEEDYLVYFYSVNCGHCKELKGEIINYYFTNKETMYFVCTDQYVVFGSSSDLTGINSINYFYIFGTPFLIKLHDKEIVNYYPGVAKIREYIETQMQK